MRFKPGTKGINIAGAHEGSMWPVGSVCTVVEDNNSFAGEYTVTFYSAQSPYFTCIRFPDQLIPLNAFFKRLYGIK